jgi:hypothetical protein
MHVIDSKQFKTNNWAGGGSRGSGRGRAWAVTVVAAMAGMLAAAVADMAAATVASMVSATVAATTEVTKVMMPIAVMTMTITTTTVTSTQGTTTINQLGDYPLTESWLARSGLFQKPA